MGASGESREDTGAKNSSEKDRMRVAGREEETRSINGEGYTVISNYWRR